MNILNIGGISNITIVGNYLSYDFTSRDIGPGNCLIDAWVRKNSNKKFDVDGQLASTGKTNEIILEQAQELYSNRSNKKTLKIKEKIISHLKINVPTFKKSKLPKKLALIKITTPGSRFLK